MIYLDNCATTPLDPAAAEAMARISCECFGNPSSIHTAGRQASTVLQNARQVIATSLNARPGEIVLSSSGTEANNFVVSGVVRRWIAEGPVHVITSATEHASVYNRLAYERKQWGAKLEVTYLPVDSEGLIAVERVAETITPDTRLISLIHCNNETGVLQDLDGLSALKLRNPRVLLHMDIVQSYLKWDFDVRTLPVDFLTATGHKVYGPKGIAFAYVRDGMEPEPLIVGGAQEEYRRGGTENVAAAAALAAAIRNMPGSSELRSRYARLESVFMKVLDQENVRYVLHGPRGHARRMPGIFNLSFEGITSKEDLQIALDLEGVLLSSTSACHSGVVTESHVLKAMGVEHEAMCGSVRICFNKFHDENDIRTAARIIARVAKRIAR